MKKRLHLTANFALLVILGFAFWAINPVSSMDRSRRPPSSQIIKDIGDVFFEWMKENNLNLRMNLGLKIERLPDVSVTKAEKDAATAKAFLARLEKVLPEELPHEDELSLDVLRRRFENIINSARFYWLTFPVTPYATPIIGVNIMFANYVFKDKETADHYLELLGQYPTFIAQISSKLEGQFARDIVIPREEMDLVVPFLRSIVGGLDRSPLGVSSDRLESLAPGEVQDFRAQLSRALEAKVNPALNSLIAYLDGDYRKKAPEDVGLSQYPGGKEFYAWLVKYHTTLDLSSEEVHNIGLKEVEQLNAKMNQVQASLGFKGSRSEFRESLKKNPRMFPRTAEEVGERMMSYIRRIEPKLDEYFLHKPKAPYGVKRLDLEREAAETFGYYQKPTAADPVGYYRYNASNLPELSLLSAGELIYHELIPGHHFQINLAYENEAIPAFRRETRDTSYSEGWAEYAASLAGEMGMYSDPYDLYGRLSGEMFMSTRLVVDTGMNTLGWPRSKAVEFIRENQMENDAQIYTESLRYSADWPAQALAYRMGYLKFRELREKAKAALGIRFDIRRFHDALLSSGSLPLTTLERHIDWFIKKEKERN